MPRAGYGEARGAGRGGFPDPAYAAAAAAGPFGPFGASGRGAGRGGGYWGPEAYMGYYPMPGPAGAYYPPAAAAAAAAPMYPRGRGGFFPGGKNWAGARPPPPGQPGFSSGLQVRLGDRAVANMPSGWRLYGVLPGLQLLLGAVPPAPVHACCCSAAASMPAVGLYARIVCSRPCAGRSSVPSALCCATAVPPTHHPAMLPCQVVVHNLPWDCTWQQLKDAFIACGEIERADVVFDSRGRSR